jgi:cell division protein FtsN
MTRDYKNSPRRAARGGGSGKTAFTGVVIGLLLGIITALGIALYLNRSPSPFVNKTQQLEPKKPAEAKAPETKPMEPAPLPGMAKPGDKPRFDFYEILPGDKEATKRLPDKPAKETAPLNPSETAPAKAPESAPAKAAGKDTYFLQAGSFRSAADADNLKARLALIGLQANVMQADVPNMGTMYRVRVGPYQSSDAMTMVKDQLAQNGIQASVVKLANGRNN